MNGLSIIRKSLTFENNFAQIPNSWARDRRIGFRAKGILMLLMSHSDGWKTSLEEMAKLSSDGISAIRSAVEQLEEHGYLTRTRIRNEQGQLTNSEWILSDPFEPKLEKPTLEKPILENQTLKNTNIKENKIEENKIEENKDKINDSEFSQWFSQFWNIYPRKEGKGAARSAYIKALKKYPNAAQEIINAARRYAHNPSIPEKKFIPHPATWLNQERWLDDDLPVGDVKQTATDIARDILQRSMGMADGEIKEITDGH